MSTYVYAQKLQVPKEQDTFMFAVELVRKKKKKKREKDSSFDWTRVPRETWFIYS